jgi:hypothetical protein
MKLCPECSRSPWPFVMVALISFMAAFLTWLTVSLSGLGTTGRLLASGAVFIAVGSTLVHYVISCIERHCRHGKESGHSHGAVR